MDPSCLVTTVQAGGGGVLVWGIFFFAHFRPIWHRLNATAYLSIVSNHVHPFMATMYPSSDGYFQQENAPCHKARIISNWFLEHEISHKSPSTARCYHINMGHFSKECFQHLVVSMSRRIKAVLKAKGGQTQYHYGVPNNPLGECIEIV